MARSRQRTATIRAKVSRKRSDAFWYASDGLSDRLAEWWPCSVEQLRGLVKPRNLQVIGIKNDGERTVVDEVDLHVGAKDAVRHMLDVLAHKR